MLADLLGNRLRSIRLRVDPGRRGAVSVCVAAALATVVAGIWVLAARPHSGPAVAQLAAASRLPAPMVPAVPGTAMPGVSAPPMPSGGGSIGQGAGAPQGASGQVVVHVAGKVRRPGLVRVPAGARAFDAVQAAGGALPGVSLDSVNLAAKVSDGEQIVVGAAGAAPGAPAGSGAAARSAGAGPVDLNVAGADQLQTLPGVGPVLAQHILDWRGAHGRFTSVDQLQQVSGIGPAKFAALKSLVSV